MVKIVGLCASPRKSASEYVTEQCLAAIREAFPDVETELVSVRGKKIDRIIPTHSYFVNRKINIFLRPYPCTFLL